MRRPSLSLANGSIGVLMGVTVCTCGCEEADGEPSATRMECGSAALYESSHGLCEGMDAEAVGNEGGDCLCLLGYAWDGTRCVALGNCACEGRDCDKLTETLEDCQSRHASCGQLELACGSDALYESSHDLCGPMDAKAVGDEQGDCRCFLGYGWDGEQCVALANCACVGRDCDKLTATLEECETQHASCN